MICFDLIDKNDLLLLSHHLSLIRVFLTYLTERMSDVYQLNTKQHSSKLKHIKADQYIAVILNFPIFLP
jgi:hypothetical protein